jgi:HEAT repeat protein
LKKSPPRSLSGPKNNPGICMALIKKKFTSHATEDERAQGREFDDLVRELESPEAMARRWAARDLADYPDAAAALVDRLTREQDISVREIILSSLAYLGNAIAVDGLVHCLRSEDSVLRNESIEVMKQLPDKVAPIMRGLLHDQDADVRIFAVNILESLRHPEVENWLIEVIQTDAHVNVCATALDLLVEVGTAASATTINQLKARFISEPYIQFSADLALKRIAED